MVDLFYLAISLKMKINAHMFMNLGKEFQNLFVKQTSLLDTKVLGMPCKWKILLK